MTYSDIAPARPGRIAEQEEFDSAQGSVEKLELFLKRHPDGALAEMARQALDRLKADREQKPR